MHNCLSLNFNRKHFRDALQQLKKQHIKTDNGSDRGVETVTRFYDA